MYKEVAPLDYLSGTCFLGHPVTYQILEIPGNLN